MYYNANHDIDKVIKFKLNLQSHKIIIPMKYLYIHIAYSNSLKESTYP